MILPAQKKTFFVKATFDYKVGSKNPFQPGKIIGHPWSSLNASSTRSATVTGPGDLWGKGEAKSP